MKRLGITLAVFALAVAGSRLGSARTIKFATLAPEGTVYHDIFRDMGEDWRKASDGALRLRIYPGAMAGDESDMVRKMRIGQLQAAAVTAGGLANISPEIRALVMPMMLADDAEVDYVRERMRPRIELPLEKKGFKVLGWGDVGWIHFFSQKPVVYPDDMKPLKLFTWSTNSAYNAAWKDLGFQPVPMTVSEIHLGLASKLINVLPVPPFAALSYQWFPLAPHMTALKFSPLLGAVVIDARLWRGLPAELRPKLQSAADRASERLKEARRLNGEAIRVMQKHGLIVHEVPSDARAAWERRARRAYPGLAGTAVPQELIDDVERLRNEYRKSHGAR